MWQPDKRENINDSNCNCRELGKAVRGFISLLNLEDDMEVVGQARDGEEALTPFYQLQMEVCIMDIDMS